MICVLCQHIFAQYSEVGPVENTYGNFILEIFESSETPKPCFRTYHFDANTNDTAITKEQVYLFVSYFASSKSENVEHEGNGLSSFQPG